MEFASTRRFCLVGVGILACVAATAEPMFAQGKTKGSRFRSKNSNTTSHSSALSFQPQAVQSFSKSSRRQPSKNVSNFSKRNRFSNNVKMQRPAKQLNSKTKVQTVTNSSHSKAGRTSSTSKIRPKPGNSGFSTIPNKVSNGSLGQLGPSLVPPNTKIRPLRPEFTLPNFGNSGKAPNSNNTVIPPLGPEGNSIGNIKDVVNTSTLKPSDLAETLNPNTVKPGVLKPEVLKPNNLKPEILNPDTIGKAPELLTPNVNGIAKNPQIISLADKLAEGKLDKFVDGALGSQLKLADQLKLQKEGGDVALQLELADKLAKNGGWGALAQGKLAAGFANHCFAFHGGWWPGFYPGWCLYPHWSDWVQWCWDWHWPIHGIDCWDPRPIWCQPIICHPCPTWIGWGYYPIWAPLPTHVSGTWINVAPAPAHLEHDLQLLAIRFVDAGHPEQDLGARFRVVFRNNSDKAISTPFNIVIVASDETPTSDAPYAGFQIENIDGGDTKSVDIRLPFLNNPVSKIQVLIDSHQDIAEEDESNNGTAIKIADILPVDPVLFGSEDQIIPAGSTMNLAGEGLGPEPGRVVVHAAGLEWEATIEGWSELGVRVALPALPVADDSPAEILLIRGDGAVTNPLSITLTP